MLTSVISTLPKYSRLVPGTKSETTDKAYVESPISTKVVKGTLFNWSPVPLILDTNSGDSVSVMSTMKRPFVPPTPAYVDVPILNVST